MWSRPLQDSPSSQELPDSFERSGYDSGKAGSSISISLFIIIIVKIIFMILFFKLYSSFLLLVLLKIFVLQN